MMPRWNLARAGTALLTAGLLSPAALAAPSQVGAWEGTYHYVESYRGPERTGIVVAHRLRVYREAGRLLATIYSEGYQDGGTTRRCRAEAVGRELSLYFLEFGNGKTANRFGVQQYKPGALMLTLRRSGSGKRAWLLTYWHAYEAAGGTHPSGRVYFKR